MTFSFPEGLAPEVYPLAWLIGAWRGPGFVEYPDIPKRAVVTEARFEHDGGPYLSYRSTTWLLDGDLQSLEQKVDPQLLATGALWGIESGFWRVAPSLTDGGPGAEQDPAAAHDLEVLLADPSGYTSVFLGQVAGPRINLATDAVVRTSTGAQVGAGSRIYGLVNSELFWALDLAAFGYELQSYASGRMQRVS
ncbi:MAG: FABP family protein [Beutenbergiaceae bacterium]